MASLAEAFAKLSDAEGVWGKAITDHQRAAPNDAYADRLREFAHAAQLQGDAFSGMVEHQMSWDPVPRDSVIWPYELSPDSGRVGDPELWLQFDAAYERFRAALEQTAVCVIGERFAELARIAELLALDVDRLRQLTGADLGRQRLGA